MSPQVDAVVAGHLCLDVIPDLARAGGEAFRAGFTPGHLMEIGGVSFSTGGPVSNVGLALHRLGVRTALMGKVGDDLFGQAVVRLVENQDPALAQGMIVDPDVDTSYTVVLSPPGVDRILLHCPGANDAFRADDIPYERLRQARLFHFGYPPLMRRMYENGGRELVEIFRRAGAAGVTTSLDMAVPDPNAASGQADWRAILQRTLPYVDLFLPSIEEILFMLRRPTYDALLAESSEGDILPSLTPELLTDVSRQLLAWGAAVVGLKLGYRGLYVRSGEIGRLQDMGRARPSDLATWAGRELWAPCFQVDVIGAAGAGDATIAGFLAALLHDLSPEETVTAATAVGACNVEAVDTLSGLQSWEETMRRVAAGWPRHDLQISAPGWRFDDAHGLWIGATA